MNDRKKKDNGVSLSEFCNLLSVVPPGVSLIEKNFHCLEKIKKGKADERARSRYDGISKLWNEG
jgi:hypothetical protein